MAEKKIAGRVFKVDAPLATVALSLQFRVMNILSNSPDALPTILGAVTKAADAKTERERLEANASLLSAMIGILGKMRPEDGTRLMSDLVSMAKVQAGNGRFDQADIDTEFSTDPSGLYELVGFVLKETIGPFISGLVGNSNGGAAALR